MRKFPERKKLTLLERVWPPALMRRIRELEQEVTMRRIGADFLQPMPVWIGGDPRFEGEHRILCRIHWSERKIGEKTVACFVPSPEQGGTLIGDTGVIAGQTEPGQ